MDQADYQSMMPPKQQNPLLIRKPLNLGTSFTNYSNPDRPAEIQNPLTAHEVTCLYFGSGWCNISKPFTKQLLPYYEQINLQRKKLEIIYIGVDKSAQEYEQGTKGMTWIGIPVNDARMPDLKEFYNVRSVPTLILIDKKGEQVSSQCRNDLYSLGQDEAFQKWKKLKEQQEANF